MAPVWDTSDAAGQGVPGQQRTEIPADVVRLTPVAQALCAAVPCLARWERSVILDALAALHEAPAVDAAAFRKTTLGARLHAIGRGPFLAGWDIIQENFVGR